MEKAGKIFSLIPKVMAKVGAIGKSGYNEHSKYKFRSIDDIYNKLQPVLAEVGVFFTPQVLESHEDQFQSAKGTNQVRIRLRVKYLIYADDGSNLEAIVEGEAIDTSDKATNKALTAAFKYMLIQIFCIAIEGQDDADQETPDAPPSVRSTHPIRSVTRVSPIEPVRPRIRKPEFAGDFGEDF